MPLGLTILGLALAAFVFYIFFVETLWHRYESLKIRVCKPLPAGGISILHLSDMHFKKWDPRKLRIFQHLGRNTVDLILITGDMMDDHHGNKTALKALSYLRSRHGIYCVFGNHEYLEYRPREIFNFLVLHKPSGRKNRRLNEFREGLNRLGIVHLGNRNLVLKELGITLVGVDDFKAGMSRMARATENLSRKTFNILLAHHPDSLLAAKSEWFDFALCGHTHGGQIRLPFIGPLFTDSQLPKHMASGRVKINGIDTYISRGFSSSRFTSPRLLCRPELTRIHLVPQGANLAAETLEDQDTRRGLPLSMAFSATSTQESVAPLSRPPGCRTGP